MELSTHDVDREMVTILKLAHSLTHRQHDRFITYLIEMALIQAMAKVEGESLEAAPLARVMS